MLKTKVLQKLELNKGEPISGAKLASEFQVSRTAIWKVINGLKEDGFPIESLGKKGYILSQGSDILNEIAIKNELNKLLKGGGAGSGSDAESKKTNHSEIKSSLEFDSNIKIHIFDQVTSTNVVASKAALEGCQPFETFIANEQTQGKGRLGRNFYSPSSKGIYLSMVIKPTFDMSKALLITTAASVAVAKAIEDVTGLEAKIKWVNDIFVNGKKVVGILTEALSDFETGSISNIILGIGINCHPADLPDNIKNIAGDLGGVDRNKLTANVINNVIDQIQNLDSSYFIEDYKSHSMVIGKEIMVYKSGIKEDAYGVKAKATGINQFGGLEVQYEDGTKDSLNTGEISISVK